MSREFDIEEKIYQGFLLLTAHDEFIQDVEKIRKQYDIDWITGDEEDEMYRRFFDQQHLGDLFDHEIERYDYSEPLRFDHEINDVIYAENDKYKQFYKDVDELMKKYHLSKEFNILVDIYIQQDFVLSNSSPLAQDKLPNYSKKEGCMIVRVYANTTKKEYDHYWRVSQWILNSVLKGKRSLKKSIDNLRRDVEIARLKREGKTANEIVRAINDSGKFENKLSGYDEVYIIINKLNKRINKFLTLQDC